MYICIVHVTSAHWSCPGSHVLPYIRHLAHIDDDARPVHCLQSYIKSWSTAPCPPYIQELLVQPGFPLCGSEHLLFTILPSTCNVSDPRHGDVTSASAVRVDSGDTDGRSWARLTKAYDVTIQRYRNSHAKIENGKIHILRCMGSKFCAKFQRCPLKFHKKIWTHTPQHMHFMRY